MQRSCPNQRRRRCRRRHDAVGCLGASINHGRNMDETWTIHGQLASSLAAQRLRHALSRKRCAARSTGVHERPWHINVPKSHFYELIL